MTKVRNKSTKKLGNLKQDKEESLKKGGKNAALNGSRCQIKEFRVKGQGKRNVIYVGKGCLLQGSPKGLPEEKIQEERGKQIIGYYELYKFHSSLNSYSFAFWLRMGVGREMSRG